MYAPAVDILRLISLNAREGRLLQGKKRFFVEP
jgi:hypothetical protein